LKTNNKILKNKELWDKFWKSHFATGGVQWLLSFIRKNFNGRAVRYFMKTYFNNDGLFVEMGSGSSQSSVFIQHKFRKFYCLDFSFEPLTHTKLVPTINGAVQGNLFHLPFSENSIDGIWNLGVMEHFTDNEIDAIFQEFHRVLKPEVCAILFWPPLFGWYKFGALTIEKILSLIKRRSIKLYPGEINLFRSKRKIRSFCKKHGFSLEHCRGIYLDLFNHVVVVIRKNSK